MGYVKHHAVVITSSVADDIGRAAKFAQEIGLQIIGPSEETINGYRTILVCPDGSKEGWRDSKIGDEKREVFRVWLSKQRHSDGSSSFEWAEMSYGSDDGRVNIEATEWDDK